MATGISAYSKTAADNATASSEINWAEGQSPGSVNNSARQMMADIAKARDDQGGALNLAGGTTAYTLTSNGSVGALAAGARLVAVVNAANTAASTLAVDSLGAKAIRKVTTSGATPNDIDIDAGDLQIDQHAEFEYDPSANAAAGAWILRNPFGRRDGTIRRNRLCPHENLTVVYVSATTVDVDADAVILFDSNSNPKRFASLNESPAVTSSGANGLDTGSEGSSRWYHIWAIGKADGTLDALLSESATAPTLPSGYIYKGYLGAIYNDSSSDFRRLTQRGNIVSCPIQSLKLAGTDSSYTLVDCSTGVPPTASAVELLGYYRTASGSAVMAVLVASDSSANGTRSISGPATTSDSWGAMGLCVMTTAQQIYYQRTTTGNGNVDVRATGWVY